MFLLGLSSCPDFLWWWTGCGRLNWMKTLSSPGCLGQGGLLQQEQWPRRGISYFQGTTFFVCVSGRWQASDQDLSTWQDQSSNVSSILLLARESCVWKTCIPCLWFGTQGTLIEKHTALGWCSLNAFLWPWTDFFKTWSDLKVNKINWFDAAMRV